MVAMIRWNIVFDKARRQYIEYVQDQGRFFDHPHKRIQATFKEVCGSLGLVLGSVKNDY